MTEEEKEVIYFKLYQLIKATSALAAMDGINQIRNLYKVTAVSTEVLEADFARVLKEFNNLIEKIDIK